MCHITHLTCFILTAAWCDVDSLDRSVLAQEAILKKQVWKLAQEVLTEEDFLKDWKHPTGGALPAVLEDQEAIRAHVVGAKVRPQQLSAEQLHRDGYESWRVFVACRLIQAC